MRNTPGRMLTGMLAICGCLLTGAFGAGPAGAAPGRAAPGRAAPGRAGPAGATAAAVADSPRTASGTVRVTAAGPVRTVRPTLLGLNGIDTTGPAWNSSSFDAVLKKFGPGVIRYPGGTAANYWSWAAGWFQPGHWPGEPGKAVDDTLPAFGTGLAAAGATPLFNLNTVTYDGAIGSAAKNTAMLNQQLQALHTATADDLPVKMVELGNELYQSGYIDSGPNGQDYSKRFPTAADYATQMNSWIAAIHAAFPGAKVAAVATDANDVSGLGQRRRTWNAGVLPVLKGENAVTIHDNLRVFDASASAATVLAFPYLHFQKLKAHELALLHADGLPVWVTEFNLADLTKGHVFQGTWLHGLFVAAQALLFTGDPGITYAGLNDTVGTASAPIFDGTSGFGSGGPKTVPLALTAAGTTLAVIQAAFHRASSAQPLSFSPAPALGSTGAPAVLGEDLSTTAGQEAVLVNLSGQPVTLSLSAVFAGGYKASQLTAASVLTKVTGPGSVSASSSAGTGTLKLEPYALADVRS